MKNFAKCDFGKAQLEEIMPGETVVVSCQNHKEVASLRSSAVQFVKLYAPGGISRFSTKLSEKEDGSIDVELTAMPD